MCTTHAHTHTHTHTLTITLITISFAHRFTHVRTCLKISSSSLRLRSSTCLLPLSSASRRRRSRSASSVKAWILRSSWRWISSLDKVSNRCSSSAPTTLAWDASSWEVWAWERESVMRLFGVCKMSHVNVSVCVSPCVYVCLSVFSRSLWALCQLSEAPAPPSAGHGQSSVPGWAPDGSPCP